jgi:hypothetical protein
VPVHFAIRGAEELTLGDIFRAVTLSHDDRLVSRSPSRKQHSLNLTVYSGSLGVKARLLGLIGRSVRPRAKLLGRLQQALRGDNR